MSLSTRTLISLALGVGVGIFFGEMVGFIEVVGDIFIKFLQMTVLPYVMVSLIVGLGQLNYQQALVLAKKCSVLLLFLWMFTLTMVILMPGAFPNWTTASFFSTTLIEIPPPVDFLALYIPANPFFSMANTLVPAVVVFSIAIGVALIGVPKKESLLEPLGILVDVLLKIENFVIKLSPIGIFAIAANAAGTMNVEDIGRWQVYLLTYLVVWVILSFWILPALVTSFSTLTYWDVVGFTRDALVTAFATGSLLVVLPTLAEKSKELLKKCELNDGQIDPSVNVLFPLRLPFQVAGNCSP